MQVARQCWLAMEMAWWGGGATKAGLGGVEATRTLEVRRGRAGKEEHAEAQG